jgi:predicted nucleic acid-binding protein
MKKLKIYLDTSVISYLDQQDAPERMADTLRLWEDIKSDMYDVVISDLAMAEIDRCAEHKRSFMRQRVAEINFENVSRDEESRRLSTLYFERGGLPPKSKDDAMHIAIATIRNCDIILSWNFRHIVNLRAITAVEAVNIQEGYKALRIMAPSMLLLEKEG